MGRSARTVALGLHITSSVGWIGAALAFVPLAVLGATSDDVEFVRAAFLAMYWITVTTIVPLAMAAATTGLVCAKATPWGLTRHWWVLFKLVLTSFCLAVLLVQIGPIGELASMEASAIQPGLSEARRPLVHVLGGLVFLLAIQGLGVAKPRGLTPWAG